MKTLRSQSRPAREFNSQGFSLLETLLVMGLSIAALGYLKEPLTETMRLHAMTKDRNLFRNLEQQVRRSIIDDARFAISQERNSNIRTCSTYDKVMCTRETVPITLYLNDKLTATGRFAKGGESCEEACPIRIEASYRALCYDTVDCDIAPAYEILYSIFVQDNLYKFGAIQRTNQAVEISDDIELCGADVDGQTTFVSKLTEGQVNCIPPERATRAVSGLTPTDCVAGTEVMVAIDGSGKGLCQPIVRQK